MCRHTLKRSLPALAMFLDMFANKNFSNCIVIIITYMFLQCCNGVRSRSLPPPPPPPPPTPIICTTTISCTIHVTTNHSSLAYFTEKLNLLQNYVEISKWKQSVGPKNSISFSDVTTSQGLLTSQNSLTV